MSDLGDVGYYRDMTTILRDRIADAINRGLTLEQTQSEGLTSDYDVRWGGGPNAFWTTEDFGRSGLHGSHQRLVTHTGYNERAPRDGRSFCVLNSARKSIDRLRQKR